MESSSPPQGSRSIPRFPMPPNGSPANPPRHVLHTVTPQPGAGRSRIPSPSRTRTEAKPAQPSKSPFAGAGSILETLTPGQKPSQTVHAGAGQLQPKPPGQVRMPVVPRVDLSKLQSSSSGVMSTPSKDTSPGPPQTSTSPIVPATTEATSADRTSGTVSASRVGRASPGSVVSKPMRPMHGSPAAQKLQRVPVNVPSPAPMRSSAHSAGSPAARRPRSAFGATVMSSPSAPRASAAAAGSPVAKIRPASAAPSGSPSPSIPKTMAGRTSLEARRAGSVDKSKGSGETRASMLRRSASVDKMRSSSAQRSGPARPVSAARASIIEPRPGTAGSEAKQPHPPAQPRPTRTSMLRANPSPARQAGQVGQSPAARANPSPARRGSFGESSKTPAMAKAAANSILSTIHEKPKVAQTQPAGSALPARPASAPNKPVFSLNLSAIKREESPAPEPQRDDHQEETPMEAPAPVPKLNLTTVLQQQEEDAGAMPSYPEPGPEDMAPDSGDEQHKKGNGSKPAKKSAPPPDPPEDHYYFYPKMDPQEERKTIEAIERLPKALQKQMRRIYGEMVEAKQNCEAIAFRGHRLLDQLQNHHKEKMLTREQELMQEIAKYQQQSMQTQAELTRIRSVLNQQRTSVSTSSVSGLQAPPGFGGHAEDSEATSASPSVSMGGSMSYGCDQQFMEQVIQQVEGSIVSSRNEMAKLQTDMMSMRQSLAGATSMQEVTGLLVADAVHKMAATTISRDQGLQPAAGIDKSGADKRVERAARLSDDAAPMQDV